MKHSEGEEAIVLSTGRVARDLAILFAVISVLWVLLFGLIVPRYGYRTGPSSHADLVVASGSIPALLACIFPILAVTGLFRRITIDGRGVTVARWLRQPARVEWSEVRRVRWLPRSAVLQGDRVTVDISWEIGKATGDGERARERVRAHLALHFDLSEGPRRPQWSLGSLWRIGWATCAIALVVYGAYRGALSNPAQMRLWALLLMSPIAFAYAAAFLLMLRDVRKPDAPGRWRPRLT